MKLKLTKGTENWLFEDDGATYILRAASTLSKRTVGEIVPEGVGNVVFGRIELWKVAKGGVRIEETRALSKDFYDEHYNGEAYRTAVRDGFELMPGAEEAAKLLIKHKFAANA